MKKYMRLSKGFINRPDNTRNDVTIVIMKLGF